MSALACGARSELGGGGADASAGGATSASTAQGTTAATTGGTGSTSGASSSGGCVGPEVCNGKDDDCDGIVDADCEVGGCTPELIVLDVQKSMPSCFVDAVQPGSMGSLDFPCTGGPVSSTFGPIVFTGSVTDGVAFLTATTTFLWGDGCTWESSQVISGSPASGTLQYGYEENPIAGVACLPPCFANGTIQVVW